MLENMRGTHTNKRLQGKIWLYIKWRQNMYHAMYCGQIARKK